LWYAPGLKYLAAFTALTYVIGIMKCCEKRVS
jgi:hypothetical protein